MDAVIEPTQGIKPTRAGKPRKVNHALAGALLAAGMSYEQVAPRVGAATGNSLRVGLAKQGVSATSMRNPEVALARKITVTAQIATEAAEIVKERLHGRLGSQIEHLSKRKVGKLASKGQGEAAVLKTMAETWRTLNGNPDSITFSFGASAQSDD